MSEEARSVPAIELPVPLALARSAETLTPSGAREPRFEPKWDGYRALVAGGRIWSRTGTDLGRFFPDLVPVLRSRLSANAVLDGELVAWDVARGRLDFSALQARLTAGRRITSVAARRPAQLICFDLLADSDGDLRGRPLSERRARLTDMLLGQAPPVVLCQQTSDLGVAEDWFATLSAGGIEGIVVKDAAAPYPTDRGQRVWWKVKARQVLDLLAIGVLGDLGAPTALVLAAPDASARVVGVTTVLPRAVARALAPLLQATGSTWERQAGWTSSGPSVVSAVEPVMVEVSADVAVDDGVLRHAARLVRVRPDLEPNDLLD